MTNTAFTLPDFVQEQEELYQKFEKEMLHGQSTVAHKVTWLMALRQEFDARHVLVFSVCDTCQAVYYTPLHEVFHDGTPQCATCDEDTTLSHITLGEEP